MVSDSLRRQRLGAGRGVSQGGFTYLWLLVAVALIGIGLAATAEVAATVARRARMAQADWAGTQYVQAIGSYYAFSPSTAKTYPSSLADLLEDRRGPVVRRHLRSLYRNPFNKDGHWEIVVGGDARVHGVRLVLPEGVDSRERLYVYAQPGLQGTN